MSIWKKILKFFSGDKKLKSPYYLYVQVATFANLPTTGNFVGRSAICLDTKKVYIWNGSVWKYSHTELTDLTLDLVKADPAIADALAKRHTQNTDKYLTTQVTHTIYVDKNRTDTYTPDGSFTKPFLTIQSAIDAISDATVYNRYLVNIAPGEYTEQIIMKEYVNLTGNDNDVVWIKSDVGDVITSSAYSDISNLFIEYTGSDSSKVGLRIIGQVMVLDNVTFFTNYTSIQIENGAILVCYTGGAISGEADCVIIKAGGWAWFQGFIFSGWGDPYYDLTIEATGEAQIISDCEFYNERINDLGTLTLLTPASRIKNDSTVTGETVKDALETLYATVDVPATFQQFMREFLLVGDSWTITHASDPDNKRIIAVKTQNGGTGTIDITPDNVGDFIQEDNTKTDFTQVLDHNANPIEAFALKNRNPVGVIDNVETNPVTPGAYYEADTIHYLAGGNNDASIYIDSIDENGGILTLHLVSGGSGYYYGYFGLLGSGDGGAVISVTDIAPDIMNYDTSKGWYVSTTDASQFDSSSWIGINNIRFDANLAGSYSQSIPVGTQIKYLISMDGRVTWKSWNGSAWVIVALADIDADGMAQDVVQALTIDQWNLLFVAGTFDIVASLKTTDSTVSPYVSEIDVNYIIPGYHVVSLTDININEISDTGTIVTNISTDTLVGLKTNILISNV